MKGKFITIEGVEGVGKSTQIESLQQFLRQRNIDFDLSREPGGTFYAEKIRQVLLEINEENLDPRAELLLIFAARAQHLSERIIPALDSGQWVLCDRFTDATYAYQGGGRELGSHMVEQLETLVQGALRPDLTIILDLDPEIGLERARDRADLDRFEREELEFFKRVRGVYLQRAKEFPQRYLVIDAAGNIESVRDKLLSGFAAWIDANV
ncbi:MAG: dTMP kinase [Pseudomonadales bacterium]|nr:dTMP kinase [Pseudomonadales bacterium]